MNTASTSSTSGRDWRALARRRWPLVAVGLAALVLGAWIVSHRGQRAEGAEAKGAESGDGVSKEGKEGTDSVVALSTASRRLIEIELTTVSSSGAATLTANGTITYDANHVSVVASRAEGRVVAVRADLGQAVQQGSVLAILESSEVGQTRGELERAQANLEVAKQTYEREKSLYEQQVSSQKEMLEAQAAYRSAQAEYNAARSKIRALGASVDGPDAAGGSFALVSSVAGTVVERNAMPGQIAGPATNLFTVADLRRVWINVDVYESDVRRVRVGAPAKIVTRAMPRQTFRGRVTYAGGVVDTATRTLKVRVEVENMGQRLRPGMYAQVQIETPRGATVTPDSGATLLVPELAVQDLDGKSVVFVPGGTPGRFVARAITVGPRLGGGFVPVLSGLRPGDQVVTKGAFQLKSELLKASFGEKE